MTLLKNINDKLMILIKVTSVIFYLIMLFTASLQILMRFVFQAPLAWTDEVSKYTFVWGTMLGCAYLVRTHGHSSVQVLENIFHKGSPARKMQKLIIDIFCLAFYLVVAIGGISYTSCGLTSVTPALGFPVYIIYSIMPITGFMMMLFQLEHLITDLTEKEA